MKKRRTKLRKFLIRTLLFLMLLIGLTGVLARSRTVQTYLAHKAASWLGKELGVEVRIGALEFDFFRNIHLEEVFIGDQAKDTLINAKALDLQLKKYDSKNHNIVFDKATLKGVSVNIGYHKDFKDKNIDFLLDYFDGPPRPKGTPKTIWRIQFSEAVLNACDFHYFDETKWNTSPGELDEFNLHFSKINGTLQNLEIIDDSLHFTARNFRTVERSGLQVRKMNALCNIHDKGMDFDDLSLFTACSHLQGNLHFAYPGYKHMDEFISNTQWMGNVSESSICLKELSVFTADLKNHPETVQVNKLKISGTYDHLQLSKADFNIGSNTKIVGDFFMDGLPEWRTTYCEYRIKKLHTTAPDLERILNGISLPAVLHDAGTIDASGDFIGQFLDFKWNGVVQSALGNAKTDIFMNFKPGLSNAIFSGNIATDGFDLSHFNSQLGHAVFEIELDGSGLNLEHFEMQTVANISELEIRGRSFSNTMVDGELTTKNFKGKAEFNDIRLNSNFEGIIDFTGSKPVFDFTASSSGLDLYELGLDTVHSLIWMQTTVKASGLNPDDLQGFADVNQLYIHRKGKVYEFNHQKVTKTGIGTTRIDLEGDFAEGSLAGTLSVNNLGTIAINSFADVFPERIAHQPYKGMDKFTFDFTVKKPDLLYDLFVPGLKTNEVNIFGDYDTEAGTAHIQLPALKVQYENFTAENFEFHADRSGGNKLNFSASAAKFVSSDEPILTNISINGIAADGKAEYNLKFADNSGENTIDVDGFSEFLADNISLNITGSALKVNAEDWTIGKESRLSIDDDGTINCEYLYLDGIDHYIEAHGKISARKTDTLVVDFGNFGFDFIKPFIKESILDSFSGRFNGTVRIASLLGWPTFDGDISGRDLKLYSIAYGDVNVTLKDLDQSGRLSLNADFIHGILDGTAIRGNIGYKKKKGMEQLALLADIPVSTPIRALQPFFEDVLTFNGGKIGGQIAVGGNFDDPKITGNAYAKDVMAMVDYLKTSYAFSAEFFINQKGFFSGKPVLLRDETGLGTAKANLAITFNKFKNFKLDLKIDSANNLKVLNTKEGDDDIFYGTAYADGDCHIYGPFDRISMDINLKARKNSIVKILYSDVEQNQKLGYITFQKRNQIKTRPDSAASKISNVLNRINLTLNINPDLEAEFVIDKKLGDVIRGRGNGILRMVYDEYENFNMFGTFRVTQGDYVFSIPGINLLTKKVALQPGGTIIWSGDPYDAVVNMTGSFEKRISPSALMTAVSSGSQKSYAPIKVQSLLYMSGNLMSPNISFDIQTPELESSTGSSGNDVYRVIQRIRADKDETMRQAVALLLFGNFITPSFAQSSVAATGVVSGSGVAGNSLSSIASGVVNDIFARMGLPTRISVNIDDVRDL
ncbi:MAG: translocation/assembly module TamB domain-containing protein, partial [Bacteroidia bacterium]|nr:translocation/assembly module TamB domain-containing protein [Bacteroidia bacterium]